MSFGDRLKEARLDANLTQQQLADMLGVGNTAVANYENEVSSPKEDILLKIFGALKVSPNFLYQDSFNENVIEEIKRDNNIMVLKDEETKLIKKYRKLEPQHKGYINGKIDTYLEEYGKDNGMDDFITA